MTSKAQKEAQMLAAALAYQRDTEKIAKSISRATKRAVKELAGDADAIFGTFMRKGGFSTRAEAQACLDAPIVWTVRQRLIALEKERLKKNPRQTEGQVTRLGIAEMLVNLQQPQWSRIESTPWKLGSGKSRG